MSTEPCLPDSFSTHLISVVRLHYGAHARIENLVPLSGGASAETSRFDVVTDAERIPLILQRMAGARQFEASLDRALQACVQAAAEKGGVPVASVAFILKDTDQLGNGYAMLRIEGETLGPRILKEAVFEYARGVMCGQCGRILALIHSIDTETLPQLPHRQGRESLVALTRIYRGCGVEVPVFELALQWLEDNVPPPTADTLVHGDFRLGNLMVGPEGIRAVLDWEMAHIGDPMEDLGWLSVPSWRYGNLNNDVCGFGKMTTLLEAYRIAGGAQLNVASLRFWQVLGTLKWGLVCLFFAFQHLNGDVRSIERAAIGRRTSETELDLIMLIRGA